MKKMYKLYIFFTRGYGRSSMVCVCFSLEKKRLISGFVTHFWVHGGVHPMRGVRISASIQDPE